MRSAESVRNEKLGNVLRGLGDGVYLCHVIGSACDHRMTRGRQAVYTILLKFVTRAGRVRVRVRQPPILAPSRAILPGGLSCSSACLSPHQRLYESLQVDGSGLEQVLQMRFDHAAIPSTMLTDKFRNRALDARPTLHRLPKVSGLFGLPAGRQFRVVGRQRQRSALGALRTAPFSEQRARGALRPETDPCGRTVIVRGSFPPFDR